ncbi:CYTH and CHAD domain-containing protein [Arthrobacter sp. PM3]|uniref:CYTH and CHAD domain-containing protein n=1 Tax=Arthrobacter sp. PM3 TaxID=2017685 RepID=UPI000E106853|nr:CYTH and CHAD domain-containing protein [Arthrobacter sp. PM3]AXJ11119.1 CHAD domain containing protein [Arthrobacter sp. PM3]
MAADAIEVEHKYSPAESAALPRLASLPGVARVGESAVDRLDAVYFDTDQMVLAAHRITLRRRTGGHDAGWHLKLPLEEARREVTEPLGGDAEAVPERLRQLVQVHARSRPLMPVARLTTLRTSIPLCAADGTVLATFSDDRVEAQTLLALGAPAEPERWREWEIELVEGTNELLAGADDLLAANGVPVAALPSKLARALGSNVPAVPPAVPGPSRHGPASEVLLAYVSEQVRALTAHDPGVRMDAPDAVHQLRVAARRLRSALASFRKLMDPEPPRLLRAELQWLAGAVGEARDTEVMRARLRDLVGSEPPELLLGPVAQQIEENLGASYHQARAAGLAALDSDRYFRLLDALDAFLDDPPLTEAAGRDARQTIGRLVCAERQRLKSAVRAAAAAKGTPPEDAALHEVRKGAKRLRYAAEAATPVFGKQATGLAQAAEGIQEILGDLQDSVVTRETLRRLAAQSAAGGGNSFSYGRLHALEQQRGEDARARFYLAWQKSRPEPLRWN